MSKYPGITESKFLDLSLNVTTSFPLATTSTTLLLNGIAQGVDAITRVGRRIAMKYITFRLTVSSANTSAGIPQNMRVILFVDRQVNGAAAAATGAQLLNVDAMNGLPNLDNRDRFKILKEWRWSLAPIINAATFNFSTPTIRTIKGFCRIPADCRDTVYNLANNAANAGINTGGLYFMCYSDNFFLAAPPTGTWQFRLRYDDA